MIILRQKIFFKCDELYENWKKSGDPKDAYEYMNTWTNEVYIPARKNGVFVDPDPRIVRAAASYKKSQGKKETLKELGLETDKDIREAVKGTKAESKVEKILDKSTKEMKEAAQKEYAAISEEGEVILKSKDALDIVRNSNDIRKKRRPGESDAKLAKRLLDAVKHRRDKNDSEIESGLLLSRQRPRIGFNKGVIASPRQNEKASWIRAGFKPDWTEPTGQTVKLGFRKFSKQDREVVPADIVKKVKEGDGVIQKDHNGDWRIVSMKTNPPTFWDAHYDSKALASKALGGYFANKR